MNKIAIVGASAEEKHFFEEALKDKSLEVSFYPKPLDASKIDPQTTILSVFVDVKVTRAVMKALPRLKLIACRSTGMNNIDLDAAKQQGIEVKNVVAYGATTVAEYTFTLLLMLSRHMPAVLLESVAAHPDRLRERGHDIGGKTIGVVGTGNIGRSVARIAKAFGMNVIGYDPYPQPEFAKEIGFQYVDNIDILVKASDVVTLHAPYTPENHHLINKERIATMRDSAILINTARGELVDNIALLEALHSGHIAAAGIDVMEDEGLMDPDAMANLACESEAARQQLRHALAINALEKLPNVIITNHNAYNTQEAIDNINQTTADTILIFAGLKKAEKK